MCWGVGSGEWVSGTRCNHQDHFSSNGSCLVPGYTQQMSGSLKVLAVIYRTIMVQRVPFLNRLTNHSGDPNVVPSSLDTVALLHFK